MTHLNIQQGLNIEVVSTLIIKKLYEAALSVPEPLEGELDAAYMSGNLLVDRTYKALVLYLTNRFNDLHINVTDSYYIPFEDSNVQSVLMANNISSDGIGITETGASTANLGTMFKDNTTITSFDEFGYFTKANTNPPNLLFMGCSNLSSIDLSNVTTLSSEEFRGTALTNVVLPENVTTIPGNCFSWTRSLVSVTAPGVLVITQRAFDLCSGLTSFSDFSNVTTIGQNAFLDAPLTGVFNAPNLTTLETSAFLGHHFEGIECIGTLSSIPKGGFGHNTVYNTLLYVYLPYECTRLGEGSFARALALTTVKQYDKTISDYQEGETKTFLPNLGKITVFGSSCFRECKALTLTSDDITNATEIGNNAFRAVKVTGNISLPHLTSLGDEAFKDCTTLTSIDLTGSTINSIPNGAFSGCTSLTSITLPSTVTQLGNSAFSANPSSVSQININWNNIVSIGEACFFKHPAWNFVLNLPNVTHLGKNGIGNRNGRSTIRQVYLPKIAHTDPTASYTNLVHFSGVFGGMDCDLIYLRDIEDLHPGDFGYTKCIALVINNTTPPVWKNRDDMADSGVTDPSWDKSKVFADSNITNVYVPDSAVTTYQNDANWSSLANKIQPLSQLTKVQTEADLLAGQIALIEAYM